MTNNWKTSLRQSEKALQRDPIMAHLIAAHGPCTLKPHTDYYQQLIKTIISQQLSVKAAATIYGRVLALFDGKVPTPEMLLSTDIETLRATGCSYQKINYMKDLALHIIDGRLPIDTLDQLGNDDVTASLTAVKGIGEWSAHMFMIFSFGRLDILPVGDLGVRKAMMQQYGLTTLPSPAEMEAIAGQNGWRPHASVASWYLWRSLDNMPT